MSSFKIFTALFLSVFLAACGFEPLLAQKQEDGISITAVYPAIEIGNIPDRDGQYLRNLLIDRLDTDGRAPGAKAPEFDLAVEHGGAPYSLVFTPLSRETVNLGIRKDASATRAQMQVTTRMQLIDKNTKKVMFSRNLKAVGAYNLLDNQLATLVSQQNVADNILRELGNDALTELNLYFRRSGTEP
jgi:LPS-assembly lipoprotein